MPKYNKKMFLKVSVTKNVGNNRKNKKQFFSKVVDNRIQKKYCRV